MSVPYDSEGRLWNEALDLSESCFDQMGRRRRFASSPTTDTATTPVTTPRRTDSARIVALEAQVQRLTQYTRLLEHTLKAFLTQRSESMLSKKS